MELIATSRWATPPPLDLTVLVEDHPLIFCNKIGLSKNARVIENLTLFEAFAHCMRDASVDLQIKVVDRVYQLIINDSRLEKAMLPPRLITVLNVYSNIAWMKYLQKEDGTQDCTILTSHFGKATPFLRLGSELKKGGFGTVYVGDRLGEKVAIKHIPLNTGETGYFEFAREYRFSQMVTSEYILPMTDAFISQMDYQHPIGYMVMPHMEMGSLAMYMGFGKLNTPIFEPKVKLMWAWQLASAVDACHEQGIAHSDIKIENILVRDNQHLLLTDFGLAYFFSEASRYSPSRGSPHLIPPEYWVSPSMYIPEKADVWKLGITLYEIATGVCPTRVMNPYELKMQVDRLSMVGYTRFQKRIPVPEIASAVSSLLSAYPAYRSSTKDILKMLGSETANT